MCPPARPAMKSWPRTAQVARVATDVPRSASATPSCSPSTDGALAEPAYADAMRDAQETLDRELSA